MHDMGIISKIKSKLSYKEVTPLYMDDLLYAMPIRLRAWWVEV